MHPKRIFPFFCLSLFLLCSSMLFVPIIIASYGTVKSPITSTEPPLAGPADTESIQQELSEKLLRFRVLANSDSQFDQEQKNLVSTQLVAYLTRLLQTCSSKEEAITRIAHHLPAITQFAQAALEQNKASYPVFCTVTKHLFPIKLYGDFTIPAGTYDTLLVTIGEGKGSNWWCMLYPPLCISPSSVPTDTKQTNDTMAQLLSNEAYQTITHNTSKKTEEKRPLITFRLFPFLNRFFMP